MTKIAFKITENKNSGVLHGGEHDDDGSHGHRCCRPECSTSSEDCSWVGWIMVVKMIWIMPLFVMLFLGRFDDHCGGSDDCLCLFVLGF